MIIKEALNNGSQLLREFKLPGAELDAEVLLAHSLSKTRTQLYSNGDIAITPSQRRHYRKLLTRRASYEPVAYLIGKKEFYGLEFNVNRHVLIPRPETETLVELALDNVREGGYVRPSILEVGTGSGAITISLATQLKQARFTACDISRQALSTARQNANNHNVSQRISFVRSDVLSRVTGRYDMIVANLPYLTNQQIDELPRDIKKYEPNLALAGGPDGLHVYETLLRQVKAIAKPGTTILCEIGPNLRAGFEVLVKSTLPESTTVTFHNDLAGRIRVARVVLGML